MKKKILDLKRRSCLLNPQVSYSPSCNAVWVHAWSLWFSDSSLGSQTFSTPCFKIMGFDAELTLMYYWQTIRSCGKRKEVASSLFSRIHWRKPISPFGFFRTVRIQNGGKGAVSDLNGTSEKCQFTLLPVCLVCGLFQQTPCEKRTHPLSLTSSSGAPDRIFLCLLGEAHGAAGMLY